MRRAARPPLTALLLGLVLLAACDGSAAPSVSGPSSSGAGCSPEEVAEGGIAGRVVDTEGTPLSDILLQIRDPGGFSGTARTSEDGTFGAPGVSGEFEMTTTDLNYRQLVQRVTVPCGELVEVELVLTPTDG